MYKITYRKNNLTVSIKADTFEIINNYTDPYYRVKYSGLQLEIPKNGIVTIQRYTARERQRGNCTR